MEDCHHQSDFLFSNSCVACCFIMAEGQRWLFGLEGGVTGMSSRQEFHCLDPKKKKRKYSSKN